VLDKRKNRQNNHKGSLFLFLLSRNQKIKSQWIYENTLFMGISIKPFLWYGENTIFLYKKGEISFLLWHLIFFFWKTRRKYEQKRIA